MAKKKISGKQKSSSIKLMPHDYRKGLRDPKAVLDTLIQCLILNDLETFHDVLIAHLRTVSKGKLASETKLGRQTLYDLLNEDKPFNPTLSTLGAIFKKLAA